MNFNDIYRLTSNEQMIAAMVWRAISLTELENDNNNEWLNYSFSSVGGNSLSAQVEEIYLFSFLAQIFCD